MHNENGWVRDWHLDILTCIQGLFRNRGRRMTKKVIHIISHSHWDREWYMPFENHRLKLVKLVDECLELFEKSEGFRSFHLDGQTIVLDDYLEIKPENAELLKRNVIEERFHAGPWYILQDEFLVSGEASVRNLLVGIEEAKQYGKVCEVGYFPDAFGNAGQMPQLLKQAGMKAVVFGRGVKPVGFNNTITETGQYESCYSEMQWNSPDGSGLLGILFANWYNNGAEIPVEEISAKSYWDKRLKNALRYASTDHLLFMNGCDHQPVQKNLAEAIAVANRLYPDYEFIHSNFNEYIKCITAGRTGELSAVTGELTSQSTDGWNTLVNTTSSRIYLKQKNRENEVSLTNLAEPLSAMAAGAGPDYPHSSLKYAWKLLMQNHPHDSICGCSVDEVHEEMELRNQKSLQVSGEIIKDGISSLGGSIDTSMFKGKHTYPFIVMNTSGYERTGVVNVSVDVERIYGGKLTAAHDKMKDLKLDSFRIMDSDSRSITGKVEDMGVRFGYNLPPDQFRKPYMARYVNVTFEAESVPALGYKVYALAAGRADSRKKTTLVIDDGMENKHLKVTINRNGTVNLLHKPSGRLYEGICYYEDTGDIGNEYIYRQPRGDKAILSINQECSCRLIEDEEYRATYQLTQVLPIPESADETLQSERQRMIDIRSRKARRSSRSIPLTIHTYISLEKEGYGIKVRSEFDNTMKDHRLRMMIPTGIRSEKHYTDSVFEIVARPNRHSPVWTNPSCCEHQQCFTGIEDREAGLLVANYGLYEYELLPELNNTVAVTVLRAVGEMGDWGVFPTPGAQCLRHCTAMLEIIPYHTGPDAFDPVIGAYQFQIPMLSDQLTIHKGSMPPVRSFLSWEGRGIYLTGMKNKQNSNHRMVRWINGTDQERRLTVHDLSGAASYYRSNVTEEQLQELKADDDRRIHVTLRPYEIFTMGMD